MERREFLKKSALAALGTAVAGTWIVQAFNHINDNESKTEKNEDSSIDGQSP